MQIEACIRVTYVVLVSFFVIFFYFFSRSVQIEQINRFLIECKINATDCKEKYEKNYCEEKKHSILFEKCSYWKKCMNYEPKWSITLSVFAYIGELVEIFVAHLSNKAVAVIYGTMIMVIILNGKVVTE